MKIVLLPFGLPVVVDRFLFLCSAIAEKGEVSRSDGGVENLSGSVFLNPLAYGTPPIFSCRIHRGRGEFPFTSSAQELFRFKFFNNNFVV